MGALIIHYPNLEDAAAKAKTASNQLNCYADKLNSHVARKISSYSGVYTGNLSSADGFVRRKISQLRTKATAYQNYSQDISGFIVLAQTADNKIQSRIQSLTGNFKGRYGIKDNAIANFFNFISSKLNQTALGRFFKDTCNLIRFSVSSLWESLKVWYEYCGGKYFIKDMALAIGKAALAVCSIIAAVATGGALIFIVAGAILGVIALGNALADARNSYLAYQAMQGDTPDPAWAKRYGDQNTLTETLRKQSDDKWKHYLATGVDGLEVVCGVIMIAKSAKDLVKNFKKLSTTFGGVRNYLRYQYKSSMQGVELYRKAWFGKGQEQARAKQLVSMFRHQRLSSIKHSASLYFNPKNWNTSRSSRKILSGYSSGLESFKFYEFWNGPKTYGGLSGILSGGDRSFVNIAVTTNRFERMAKRINFSSAFQFIGISDPNSGADISVGEVRNVLKKISVNIQSTGKLAGDLP